MKKYVTWGAMLVLSGVYFLLAALFELPDSLFLTFVGAAFWIGRAVSGRVGLTIPGALLGCLGLGFALRHHAAFVHTGAALVLMSLALGFLVMHLIDFRKLGNWPLIPAVILFLISAGMFAAMDPLLRRALEPYLDYLLPAALILLGLILLLRAIILSARAKNEKRDAESTQKEWEPASAPHTQEPAADDYDQVPPYAYYMPTKDAASAEGANAQTETDVPAQEDTQMQETETAEDEQSDDDQVKEEKEKTT